MGTNIFKTLRMEQNEVVMCRFLADLLDPNGWHGCGTKFLEGFLQEVVKLDLQEVARLERIENVRLESTCVMAEYLIDNGRRIDIMIQNPAFSIPIEAKINARDQQGQCYDYHFYARNAKLIYLTKKVDDFLTAWSSAAADGTGKLKNEEICHISWREISKWLESVALRETPEASILVQQYIKAIESFLSQTETRKDYNFADLARDVLGVFESEIEGRGIAEKYGLKKLNESCRPYQNWKNNSKAWPGLDYRVTDVKFPERDSLQMWFRIEVGDDGYLTAGFCLWDAKTGNKVKASDIPPDTLKQWLDHTIISRDDWWVVWRFSNGKQDVSRGDVPNFKTVSQHCEDPLALGNQAAFVAKTLQIFEEQLLNFLKKPV